MRWRRHCRRQVRLVVRQWLVVLVVPVVSAALGWCHRRVVRRVLAAALVRRVLPVPSVGLVVRCRLLGAVAAASVAAPASVLVLGSAVVLALVLALCRERCRAVALVWGLVLELEPGLVLVAWSRVDQVLVREQAVRWLVPVVLMVVATVLVR